VASLSAVSPTTIWLLVRIALFRLLAARSAPAGPASRAFARSFADRPVTGTLPSLGFMPTMRGYQRGCARPQRKLATLNPCRNGSSRLMPIYRSLFAKRLEGADPVVHLQGRKLVAI
jgi:hypothetical protein